MWRTVWEDDPASFAGESTSFDAIRVLPQPAHRIPFWVGGAGERVWRRAVEQGDGLHLISVTPEEAQAPIARVRADRPEPEFVISLRTGWDPQGMEPDTIRAEMDAYREAGVSYVVCAPWRRTLDDWLGSMEQLAAIGGLTPAECWRVSRRLPPHGRLPRSAVDLSASSRSPHSSSSAARTSASRARSTAVEATLRVDPHVHQTRSRAGA